MLDSKQGSEHSGALRVKGQAQGRLLEDTRPLVHGMLQASSFLKDSGASELYTWVETLLCSLLRARRWGSEE